MSDENKKHTHTTILARNSEEGSALARKKEVLQSNVTPDETSSDEGFNVATSNTVLHPRYSFHLLRNIIRGSSSLSPCFDALRTNVASTGYNVLLRENVEADDGTSVDNAVVKELQGFFGEVYPGLAMDELVETTVTEREQVGIYYWEVLRNGTGEIVFIKGVVADFIRPVKHDNADRTVKKITLQRGSKEVAVDNFEVWERRYAKLRKAKGVTKADKPATYFREFGSSRQLNKNTGEWETQAKKVPLDERATELIAFTINHEMIPRWTTDLSSVLGEQEGGDLNLSFFDNGGIPPVIISLIGGQLSPDSRNRFDEMLSGSAKTKLQAMLVEVYSTGGSFDGKDTPAQMVVNKFGAESQQDGMFATYLKDCSSRIRRRWRIPAIITGDATDMSYATAFVSYMVSEEQVFEPMRKEIYRIINSTIMRDKSMGNGEYVLKGKPLTVKDSKQIQTALDNALAKGIIDKEEWLRQTNSLLALDMVAATAPEATPPEPQLDADGNPITPVDTSDPAGANNSRTDAGTLNQQGTTEEAPRSSSKSDVNVIAALDIAEQVAKCLMESVPVTDELTGRLEQLIGMPEGSKVFKRALTAAILRVDNGNGAEALINRGDDAHGHC